MRAHGKADVHGSRTLLAEFSVLKYFKQPKTFLNFSKYTVVFHCV
jgi:hypothetical protein